MLRTAASDNVRSRRPVGARGLRENFDEVSVLPARAKGGQGQKCASLAGLCLDRLVARAARGEAGPLRWGSAPRDAPSGGWEKWDQ